MEQGSLRCDVNLSLRESPEATYGTRSETKNVNSLRSVERAVRYEVGRQAARLAAGQRVVQETRHWHEDTGLTTPGRSKETAEDYRYFPEPDLVPVAPEAAWAKQPGRFHRWRTQGFVRITAEHGELCLECSHTLRPSGSTSPAYRETT